MLAEGLSQREIARRLNLSLTVEEFDITRERPAQLTFGGGPHHCLGAPLARAEMAEALPILAARLPAPVLAGVVSWRPAVGIAGPLAVPIRFRTPTEPTG